MTTVLVALAALVAFTLWYALAGRRWLRSKSWAQGFFAWIEPIEIALFKKSETILMGRILWVGGLFVTFYDSVAVFASSLDLTPVTTRVFDTVGVPADMRGLVMSGAITALGLIINWLRQRTTKPLELVAIAEKDITPAVADKIAIAEVAKVDALAEVKDAEVVKAAT